jgi:putative acetyltransferase
MRIVDFRPEHAEAFRRLNEAWILQHFAIEPKDRLVLDDPLGQVIAPGGRVFVALDGDDVVGCCALIAEADGFEVAKMTVAETARGSGLGRALLARCIEAGREAGAPWLRLETNSALGPAISLYRSAGFEDLPHDRWPASDYSRCDIWMELKL